MRIEAVVCCYGDEYADQLEKSMPVWSETLDQIIVATNIGGSGLRFTSVPNVRVLETDVFTAFGAHLNKAAALDYALGMLEPVDWCLHFDADVVPPIEWRAKAERCIVPGFLYGAKRVSIEGVPHDHDRNFNPFGYFQLWHTSDSHCWKWPLFDPWHKHAGCYDADFAERWPRANWKKLPFAVKHQSEPRTNWFGVGNNDLMGPLKEMGLFNYRMKVRQGFDRLDIPKPKLRWWLASRDRAWVRDVLRACSFAGPFDVYAEFSCRPLQGYEQITNETPATVLLDRVLNASNQVTGNQSSCGFPTTVQPPWSTRSR